MFPERNFECQFETLNTIEKIECNCEDLGTQQAKCKALSLTEIKDYWKDYLKQAAAVFQSSREIYYSIGE